MAEAQDVGGGEAQQAADRILRACLVGGATPDAELGRLVEAACSTDSETARAASAALFRNVVEPLADRFDPALADRYAALFLDVLERVRRRPGFELFDGRLRRLGLIGPEALQARWGRVSRDSVPSAHVDACYVLSRVTLGADVAVTSVLIDAAKRRWPSARVRLAGSAKSGALFAGDPRIEFLQVNYPRSGSLADRLSGWVELTEALEADGCGAGSLVLDPDSRLTQLGLLPPSADAEYLFFPSREEQSEADLPLARIASDWARRVLGVEARPYVALGAEDRERGRRVCAEDSRRRVAVNWGFGGNSRKRVGLEFERGAVGSLLEQGFQVILDRGLGAEESAAADAIAADAKAAGHRVEAIGPAWEASRPLADLLVWSGSLSGFAGLTEATDLFLGYDSAAGHLAAAQGVRGIDVFRGAINRRMVERWSPWGAGPALVIEVGDEEPAERTLARVEEGIEGLKQ